MTALALFASTLALVMALGAQSLLVNNASGKPTDAAGGRSA